jgi:hypothetical protein
MEQGTRSGGMRNKIRPRARITTQREEWGWGAGGVLTPLPSPLLTPHVRSSRSHLPWPSPPSTAPHSSGPYEKRRGEEYHHRSEGKRTHTAEGRQWYEGKMRRIRETMECKIRPPRYNHADIGATSHHPVPHRSGQDIHYRAPRSNAPLTFVASTSNFLAVSTRCCTTAKWPLREAL